MHNIIFHNGLNSFDSGKTVNYTFIGLMAPVLTIFNTDFTVNTDRIPNYADYMLQSGMDGILVAGTNGEGTSLSVEERKILFDAWSSAVKKTNQSLMVQVGGAPFPDVIELARFADNLKVDAILAMPELYFKPKTSQELISYLKFVSAAAPNTPLFYYHNPSHTGVNIHMGEFLEQADGQIPTFQGIKFTSNDLAEGYAARKAAKGKYTVFLGGDYLIEPGFALGFDSVIAGSMNVFPRYTVGIVQAVRESRLDIARELQHNLSDAMDIMSKFGPKISCLKLAMNLFSPINVGLARPPLQNPSPSRIEEMRNRLEPYL